LQLLPASLNDVGDAQVEFAGHYGGVGFAGEGVEVREGDGVDFVVDVEAGKWVVREERGEGGRASGDRRTILCISDDLS